MIEEERKIREYVWMFSDYRFLKETGKFEINRPYIYINPLAMSSMRYMFKNVEWKLHKDGKTLKSNYSISFIGNSIDSVVRQAWKEFVAKKVVINEYARDPWPNFSNLGQHDQNVLYRHEHWVYPRYYAKELLPYAPDGGMYRNGPLPNSRNWCEWNMFIDCAKEVKSKERYKIVTPAYLEPKLVYLENGEYKLEFKYNKPHYKGSKKLGIKHTVETHLESIKAKDISNLENNGLLPRRYAKNSYNRPHRIRYNMKSYKD